MKEHLSPSIQDCLPVNLYIPDIQEVRYYSGIAWNPNRFHRLENEEDIWESPMSVQFQLGWLISESKEWRNTLSYRLHIRHLVWKIDTSIIGDMIPSPEFSNIPEYNPARRALTLSGNQKTRVRTIVWNGLIGAHGEVIYTSLGEEVFLRNAKREMEPIGLSDNF